MKDEKINQIALLEIGKDLNKVMQRLKHLEMLVEAQRYVLTRHECALSDNEEYEVVE